MVSLNVEIGQLEILTSQVAAEAPGAPREGKRPRRPVWDHDLAQAKFCRRQKLLVDFFERTRRLAGIHVLSFPQHAKYPKYWTWEVGYEVIATLEFKNIEIPQTRIFYFCVSFDLDEQ